MPARTPIWHVKSDDELRELVRLVWEGRAVGSWQLSSWREVERIFPGFQQFEIPKGMEQAGAEVFFSDREVALACAAVPWPAAAYGLLPPTPSPPPPGPVEIPVLSDWTVLSWDEWKRVLDLLGDSTEKGARPAPKP